MFISIYLYINQSIYISIYLSIQEQVSESHDAKDGKIPTADSQEQSSAADLLDVNIDPFDEVINHKLVLGLHDKGRAK